MEDNAVEKEKARKIFAGNCDFIAGADVINRIPPDTLPEIAFVGRSNVGKSSLINALTNRNALARTSHTPGRTQQLNFFNLGDKLLLVDMPGYGYAKVSKEMKKNWRNLINTYLKGRASLRCVFVLVDSRHGLKDVDKEIMEMLDMAAVPYRIVLTKIDKQKKEEADKIRIKIETELKKHAAAFPTIYETSSDKKIGLEELRLVAIRAVI